jgi:hypothetical protein
MRLADVYICDVCGKSGPREEIARCEAGHRDLSGCPAVNLWWPKDDLAERGLVSIGQRARFAPDEPDLIAEGSDYPIAILFRDVERCGIQIMYSRASFVVTEEARLLAEVKETPA